MPSAKKRPEPVTRSHPATMKELFEKFPCDGDAQRLHDMLWGHKKEFRHSAVYKQYLAWNQVQRYQAISDFFKMKTLAQHPLGKVFVLDLGICSLCNASPGQYTAALGPNGPVWEARHPFSGMCSTIPVFPDTEAVVKGLIALAVQRGYAFHVKLPTEKPSPFISFGVAAKYGKVLVPIGDRRAEVAAENPENVIEVPGLLPGTALLFDNSNQEDNGWLSTTPPGIVGPLYGLTVWGTFYAVEYGHGFSKKPRFPAT